MTAAPTALLSSPLPSCVTLRESLKLSEPQVFSSLK